MQVLEGVRIVDAGTVLAAPGMSALLADFGADVVKVEQPGAGDPLRRFPPHVDGQCLTSKVTNRNKRSVTIDLGSAAGRDLFLGLVRQADAVVMNYRPATLRRWRLDYDDLVAVKPDLAFLHLTGFGRDGPYAERPGFARVIEAFVGLTHATGDPEGPPRFVGYAIGDAVGAVYGAFSLMLAIHHQRMTGQGQLVDLALYESLMRVLDGWYVGADVVGRVPGRVGNSNPNVVPNNLYRTGDGNWVALPVSTPNMFERLCKVLDLEHLLRDERFATNPARVENRQELDAHITRQLAGFALDDFLAQAVAAGVAAGPVNDVAMFLDDEHVRARGSVTSVRDGNLDRDIRMQAAVPKMSATPGSVRWPGHEAGQDNEDVFHDWLGLDDDQLRQLRAEGVI